MYTSFSFLGKEENPPNPDNENQFFFFPDISHIGRGIEHIISDAE